MAFLLRFSINSAKGQPGNAMLWKVSSVLENQVDKGYVLYTFEKNDIYKKNQIYEKLLLVATDRYHKEIPAATLNAATFPSLCRPGAYQSWVDDG